MNPNDHVSVYLQLQYLFVLCKSGESGGFFPDAWCLKSTKKQLHVIYKYYTDRTSKACKVALAHHRRVGVHHFMPVWKTQAVHRRQGVVPSVGCRQRLPTSTGTLWGTTLRELGECDETKCTWCIRSMPSWKHILPMDLRAESLRPAQYCSLLPIESECWAPGLVRMQRIQARMKSEMLKKVIFSAWWNKCLSGIQVFHIGLGMWRKT